MKMVIGVRAIITDATLVTEDVYFPEQHGDSGIISINFSGVSKKFHFVRTIHIPKNIVAIDFGRVVFPNLEQVIVDSESESFAARDGMLFSKVDGSLVRCLVCKGDTIKVPEHTSIICARAFYGTEFSEIVFPKTHFRVEVNAFEGSKWITLDQGTVVLESMLVKIECKDGTLVVPKEVKEAYSELFQSVAEVHTVVCEDSPRSSSLRALVIDSKCKCLKVSSPFAILEVETLGVFADLEELAIAEDHRKYKTIDGVLYSKNGKALLFYPRNKQDTEFRIPDGVERIAFRSFACNDNLTSVIMPDSVVVIESDAFYKCSELSSVHLSANLETIEDSTKCGIYYGAFGECVSLKSIVLPAKLKYLGRYTFYASGLSSVVLNEQLEQIGDYAFASTCVRKISLPISVKRLGVSALESVSEIEVYDGTAKGLISSLYCIDQPILHSCQVTVLCVGSNEKSVFLIPLSLDVDAGYRLDSAWNQGSFDL